MNPQIGVAPAPDFEHPVEMLAACHDRIRDRIEILQRLIGHLGEHGCDEQARQAASGVMRYFDTAGEHHHQDEEINLFPALSHEVATNPDAAALIERLRKDHTRMRTLWQSLRVPLSTIAAGTAASLDAALVETFSGAYREHIDIEENELFPLAARVLAPETLGAIGGEMARRRGVAR